MSTDKNTEVAFYKAMMWSNLFENIFHRFHAHHVRFGYEKIGGGDFRYYYDEAMKEITPSIFEVNHRWEFTKATFSFPHMIDLYIKERFPDGCDIKTTDYQCQLLLDWSATLTPFFQIHQSIGRLDTMRQDYVRQVKNDIHQLVTARKSVLDEKDPELSRNFWSTYLCTRQGQTFSD